MKSIVIFFDCHGEVIKQYLELNKELINKYKISFVKLNNYVVKDACYINNNQFAENDIQVIKNADVLILQVIEKDRGFLNNHEVIKFCKINCEIIKIPHYRNSIYFYKCLKGYNNKYQLLYHYNLEKEVDINNINKTLNLIKKEIEIMENFDYDKNDMEETFNKSFNEFQEIDKLSDIKMFDFYKNNFKKSRLFMGRSYPSSIFFFELTNLILEKLYIVRNEKFVDLYFAENTTEIIPNY